MSSGLSPSSPLPSFELWLPHYRKALYEGDARYILKSARTFPQFRELPVELQLHILEFAATPGIPSHDDGENVLTDMHFDWRHNKETHPTSYAHYYEMIVRYWEFDLSRALSQTCRVGRWASLRAWEKDLQMLGDGSDAGYETGGKIKELQRELVGNFREMREEVRKRMGDK